ncbi:MAG: serine/threonine-protein kinase [Acidobacteriota bacterium]
MVVTPLQMYDRLGDYTVLERLGKGGTGAVYRARHDEYGDVAIKLMPEGGKGARGRLLREAGVAASLDHPNIIKVFGIGEHRQRPYIVMELLDGLTLKAMIRAGHDVGLERRIELMKQVMHALVYAHDEGVAHRDIKPQNIFITHDGTVHVLDFGLALAEDTSTNGSGGLVGTPAYMAPEQARREEVDHRVDIFSIGAVLYELLAGARAFGGGNVQAVLHRVATEDPVPLHEIDDRIPEELWKVVLTALAKDPDERYPSMWAMLEAVERFELTLATRRDEVGRKIATLIGLIGPIPPGDPGPPELELPAELPAGYFELLSLRQRLEERRDLFEELAGELAWVEEMLTRPLDHLDEHALRGILNRADRIGDTWPVHPRAAELGRRVLQELRARLRLRKPVHWGNAGRRPRGEAS